MRRLPSRRGRTAPEMRQMHSHCGSQAGRLATCLLPLALLVVGCSDDDAGEPFELSGDASRPSAPPAESSGTPTEPLASDGPPTEVTGLDLDLRDWAGDERSPSLERYLAAVGQTVRDKVTSPLFFDSTSAQQMNDRRTLAAQAKEQGATVADTTVAYLADLQDRDTTAVAEVCVWGPSVAFVDERTGQAFTPTPPRWTPRSVTMTFVQQQWLVVDEARGRFACDEEAP